MEKDGLNWAAIGAVAGVVGVIVAVIAWVAPWRTDATTSGRTDDPVTVVASPSFSPSAPPSDEPDASPSPVQPTSMFLADLTPLETDDPVGDAADIGGVTYVHALTAWSGGCVRDQDSRYTYVVNGDYKDLSTTVGLDDRTQSELMVHMELLLDGVPTFSETIQAGQYHPISIDVSGVRELVFHQTFVGPDPNRCGDPANAVWADPVLTR